MKFCTFGWLKLAKLTKLWAPKMRKTAVLKLLHSPKLISRKISVTEKSWKIHNVHWFEIVLGCRQGQNLSWSSLLCSRIHCQQWSLPRLHFGLFHCNGICHGRQTQHCQCHRVQLFLGSLCFDELVLLPFFHYQSSKLETILQILQSLGCFCFSIFVYHYHVLVECHLGWSYPWSDCFAWIVHFLQKSWS